MPASGGPSYLNFQDFFSRQLIEPLSIEKEAIWPAEGLLCEYGKVKNTQLVTVKGQKRHLRKIFGEGGRNIPDEYYFSNIFLHNNNYHRIHAPISGRISRIERISGDLVLLRPWLYSNDPSLPALRNERINIDIVDESGYTWFLSIVGGPAVGTIELPNEIRVGSEIKTGKEVAIFLLGSTCCMASPIACFNTSVGQMVSVRDDFDS